MAVIGVPILLWNVWTVVAWLADGPQQVTEGRDSSSAPFWAARVIEGSLVLVAIAVITHLVRDVRRSGRLFTFDVLFCLAGATMFWLDISANIYMPTFLSSSNWVNLTNACGHMPFVVNPDCGRTPDPIMFTFLVETFGYLGIALAVEPLIRRARDRWPGISTRKLLGLVLLGGALIDLVLEVVVLIPLRLWTYPSPHWMSVPLGGGFRFPIVEVIAAGGSCGLFVSLRIFKDDRGLTLVERGLTNLRGPARTLVTWLALYGYVQLVLLIVVAVPVMAFGPYEPPWPKLPQHVVNGVCDAPGFTGTRYGPCPGSPGFKMPGRDSLPGRSP